MVLSGLLLTAKSWLIYNRSNWKQISQLKGKKCKNRINMLNEKEKQTH